MSNEDDPLNVPAPRAEDDELSMGTVSAFKLTAAREHVLEQHEGEFEACTEPACVQAREMLEGKG